MSPLDPPSSSSIGRSTAEQTLRRRWPTVRNRASRKKCGGCRPKMRSCDASGTAKARRSMTRSCLRQVAERDGHASMTARMAGQLTISLLTYCYASPTTILLLQNLGFRKCQPDVGKDPWLHAAPHAILLSSASADITITMASAEPTSSTPSTSSITLDAAVPPLPATMPRPVPPRRAPTASCSSRTMASTRWPTSSI